MAGLDVVVEGDELEGPDADLLTRFQQGDSESAALLYDRHHRGLYAYARSLLNDATLAEDVVHETFLRLLEVPRGQPISSVRAFLYAILRNCSLDLLRRSTLQGIHRPQLMESVRERAASREGDEAGLGPLALAALDQLPEQQRETVVLKIFGRLTFSQIAEVMSVSNGTAASRYRYALEKLAQILGTE